MLRKEYKRLKTAKGKCKICHKEFKFNSSRSHGIQIYCSNECRLKVNRKNSSFLKRFEKRKCKNCNKNFIWNSSYPTQIYCTKECYKKYHEKYIKKKVIKEKRKCKFCNKKFIWYSSLSNQIYCYDINCKIKRRKEYYKKNKEKETNNSYKKSKFNIPKINENQSKNKFKIFSSKKRSKQDSYKKIMKVYEELMNNCSMSDCKSGYNLETHHIQPLKQGGTDTFDNLIILCKDCHKRRKLHQNWQKKQIELLTLKFYKELDILGFTSDCSDEEFLKKIAEMKAITHNYR
ncbi:HNH endonuclease [Candidatus Pacearchaeota archaeon]|nr:HNH endonuclease [Candidatus Pacearchaeota archaeon]